MAAESEVIITATEIRLGAVVAAAIDLVGIGGGSQTVTVDGSPEERVHPLRQIYQVRFISPDRMLPDQLREADDYDSAVKLGRAYAAKLDQHKGALDALAEDLKVD